MRPSSSPSDATAGAFFGGVLSRGPVAAEVGDAAWLRALLDAEPALAVACAAVGLIPPAAAAEIAYACTDPTAVDVAALGREAGDTGTPVVPLVRALRSLVSDVRAAGAWHYAAHVASLEQPDLVNALLFTHLTGSEA